MSTKTICFITNQYEETNNGPGVFANYFIEKMMMSTDKYKVILISGDLIKPKYGEDAYSVYNGNYFGSTLITSYYYMKKIKEIIKNQNVDYIYFNSFRLALFSYKLDIPYFININDYYFAKKEVENNNIKGKIYYKFWRLFYKKILNRATKLFINSNFTKSQITKNIDLLEEKFKVTYKGIDLSKFDYNYLEMKDEINFLFVGSDFERKNLKAVIVALNKLKENTDKKLTLYVVGDAGNTKEKFIKLAEENNLLNDINFLGVQDRGYIKKLHNKSHIYILPSKREALGVSIIEAAASGTTVIASNVGGIPEVIEDGKEGLLVSPLDYNDLYKSINKLVDNPKFRFKITKNARKKSKKFSYDNIFKKIENEF